MTVASSERRRPVVGLVVSGAGGVETVRRDFVMPARARGWSVAVTATPTAAEWLRASGELGRLAAATGLPVRVDSRLPGDVGARSRPDCLVVAPASANTVAKLALGIADNQALTTACEAVGDLRVPVIVFPRVNAAHARHPAWAAHIASLQSAGVEVVQGADLWPLLEPGSGAADRPLPWSYILEWVNSVLQDPPPMR